MRNSDSRGYCEYMCSSLKADNPLVQRMLDEVNQGLRVPQTDTYIDNI
ncbi:MAG: hypothetical protein LBT59_17800 [Clostridiales bacterium]|nr:hypothetical protein [Clostridiales bacterium]